MPLKPSAELGDILSFAIGLERTLRGLYASVSQDLPEPEVKQALTQLADDELGHEKLLRSRYASLGAPSPPGEEILFSLFQKGRDTVRWATSPLEAIKIALALEIRGEEFYASWAEKAPNPDAKDLLNFLASEEVRHAAILKDQYRSLANEEPTIPPTDSQIIPWPDI